MFDVKGWVRLNQGEDRRIRDGHLWVYRNEIRSIPACAGEPSYTKKAVAFPKVYPRVCGGAYPHFFYHGHQ